MADNKKIYTIQINGIDQSIKQVDALSDALQFLDSKINELESRSVSITSSSNGGGGNRTAGNRTAELNTEDKLLKQIQKTEQQIANARREDYQSLLAQKDILKDIVSEAQERAAAERLSNGNYGNTMKGLKEELSDIKKVMQTTDLGDEKFQELTQRAGELTNKLKELETAYGQFGRNVGNYASAAEGFKGIQVNVGGVIREFGNAREASRTLNNELKTMAVNGQTDTEEFKNLRQAVMQMESAMNDAKKPMDDLMDAMESFTAIASVSEGFSALFGFDSSEIEKSIQKMVALQNILKGIETINKQIQTGEGIGAWIAPFNKGIDTATAKLLVYNKALLGTGKAATTAAVGVKVFGKALKGIASLGILLVIDLLIDGFTELVDTLKNVDEATKRSEKIQESVGEAYADATAKLSLYQKKVDSFNGSQEEEKKLVEELNQDLGESMGTYKSLTEWKTALKERTDAYIESMKLEAEQQAILIELNDLYIKQWNAKSHLEDGRFSNWEEVLSPSRVFGGYSVREYREKIINEYEEEIKGLQERLNENVAKINKHNKDNNLFNYSPQIKKNARETRETIEEVEIDLEKARIDAMKQGLTKTLAQLALERNKRIAEAKKTGKLVQEQIELINKQYQDKVFEARVQYHANLLNEERKYAENIENLHEEILQKEVDIAKRRNELRLDNNIDNLSFKRAVNTTTTSDGEVIAITDIYEREIRNLTYDYNFELPPKILRQYKDLADELKYINMLMGVLDTSTEEEAKEFEENAQRAQEIINKLKEFDEKYPQIAIDAEKLVAATLNDAIVERTVSIEGYYRAVSGYIQDAADEELRIEKDKLSTELKMLRDQEEKRHQLMVSRYYDDGETEADTRELNRVYKTPRIAQQTYMEEFEKGNLIGKNEDELGKYFSEYRELMDKWVNDFEEAVNKEEITWEEYLEFMNQEAIQGYLKAKTEYENFLSLYNKMSDSEKAKNEGDLEKLTRNLNNAYADYLGKVKVEQEVHNDQMKVIQNKYNLDVEVAEKDHLDRLSQATVDYHSQMISEYERAMSAISNKVNNAETKNAWGIINYGATKNALKDLQESISTTIDKIEDDKKNLVTSLAEGEISFEDFSTLMDQLNTLEVQAQDTSKNISTKLKNFLGDFWGSIDQWLQQVGQTMNTILSSLSEIQSNQYDEMIDQQEKYIEEYEKLLDKQKEITEEHASEIDSIEDELSTARGDRRQQLIDQLNAEMAAQRASLAQEKKIEKEKEKAEHKKADLEYEQAVARKHMQEAQALINAAMAVSMAAVNSWPIPAIPMMALAAAAGAAQYAAVKSQYIPKPSYGSGGVIQGKSHRDGGVPVLGGRAEVEGGEFITNKVTTSKNVELLEYINTKRRKISLEELIDFYGGNSQVKKSITTVRTKFADGGMIPTLRNDINLSDRLLTAFEDYSNRPQVVSVVEIVDKMQTVREVQTMAGLETNY